MNKELIIKHLILIGEKVSKNRQPGEEINRLSKFSNINIQPKVYWSRLASILTEEDLIHLMKGLTYCEARFSWPGGSAAATIWLLESLANSCTDKDLVDEVSNWLLSHSNNPYNPFGTIETFDAQTYSEYKSAYALRKRDRDHREETIIKQSFIDKNAQANRARHGMELRNTLYREKLIEDLKKLSIQQQLIEIAENDQFNPSFYPGDIALNSSIDVIESLSYEIRLKLASKLKGRQRGDWRIFKRKLLSTLDAPWDTPPLWRV